MLAIVTNISVSLASESCLGDFSKITDRLVDYT